MSNRPGHADSSPKVVFSVSARFAMSEVAKAASGNTIDINAAHDADVKTSVVSMVAKADSELPPPPPVAKPEVLPPPIEVKKVDGLIGHY